MSDETAQALANAASTLPNVGTTPDGILLGADTSQTPPPAVPTEAAPPVQNVNETPAAQYTEEDLMKARQEEKNKLYSRIESMKTDVDRLKEEREAQFNQEADIEAAQAREQKIKAEAEMDVRELLAQKESEWEGRLSQMQQEQERAKALLEQERQYAELTAYQTRRVEESREQIMPELIDLVTGSTQQEIDASIESLKQRSESIFHSAQDAISSAQRDSTGSRVTLPSTPENPQENMGATPEAIRNMSLQEYAKNRQALLSSDAQGRSQGLFG